MLKLFSFWRSLATYRVRIALNLKGLAPDEEIDVNLTKGAQRDAAYCSVNPMMALPALVDGDGPALFESLSTRRIPSHRCCRRMRAAGRGCAASPRSWRAIPIRWSCRACANILSTN
jgi:hypothetical protein